MSKPTIAFAAVNQKKGIILPATCRYTARAARAAMTDGEFNGWAYWKAKGWRVRKVFIAELGKGIVRVM